MKALLDTHTFLWWIDDNPRLSTRVREIMGDGRNTLFLSAVSGWEIAIKAQIGKLTIPEDIESFIRNQLILNNIQVLPINLRHALHIYTLPHYHRDPFDRMLIAQSRLENLPLITIDNQISQYTLTIIW